MTFPTSLIRPFGVRDVPLPTGRESAAIDHRAIESGGVPQPVLMENAGRSAALILQHLHPRGPVAVVCGSGNNGGDGVVVARTLASWGRRVRLVDGGGRGLPRPLLHGWEPPVHEGTEGDDGLLEGAVVVDALLGTGVRGAVRGLQAEWITRINRAGGPVISLDVPSGVDADLGRVEGEVVHAALTVAFGWPKLGTLLHPGRNAVGRLVAVEIGFPPLTADEIRTVLITPAWAASRRPPRDPDTHKNQVGSLLLLAGSPGMAGAAILAGKGALRAGVGLLRVASDPGNRAILQTALPEAIFVDLQDLRALDRGVEASSALALGPGLGTSEGAVDALRRVLEGPPRPTVLDADALNLAAAGRVPPLAEVGRERPLLLTPHPGEMSRLVGETREIIQGDRPGAAREGASRFHAALLLKGMPSLVATPDGMLRVDGGGSSDLATAGMGDVLTGVCGRFLSAGVKPGAAGALALQATGRAAARAHLGQGLSPLDVAEALPGVLMEEGSGHTDLPFPFVILDQDPAS